MSREAGTCFSVELTMCAVLVAVHGELVAAPEGRLRRLPAGERIHKRRRWVRLGQVG
jgi:hypothetical protein